MFEHHWRYAIGVGSNVGDRLAAMAKAATLIDASGLARVLTQSAVIETEAVGGPRGQSSYFNAVWIVISGLGPHQLLHLLQRIEQELGRTRTIHWGPRTIDLDMLMRDDGLVVATPVLTLPHPRIGERIFVLQPLREVAADWIHPLLTSPVSRLSAIQLSAGQQP